MPDSNVSAADGRQDLTFMAVRAHPDDECFTVGGTLARYSGEGVNTVVLICTGGENGDIVDEELNTPESKARLGEIRHEELERSCAILGVHHLEMLGYRDSGMAETPENDDPRSFNKAELEEAAGRLVRHIRKYRPHVVVTDNEEGSYGHPDHIMCNKVTVASVERAADPDFRPDLGDAYQVPKLYYTAFAHFQVLQTWKEMRELGLEMPWRNEEDGDAEPTWGLPDDEIGAVLDVHEELQKKIDSLLAHRSQIKPDMWMLQLPRDVLAGFLGVEVFQRIRSVVRIDARETDLLDGLRDHIAATTGSAV